MTAAAPELTLNDIIRQVVNDNPDIASDVWALAEKVADATPEDLIRDFFIKSLPPSIRIHMGNERNAALADVRRSGTVRSGKGNISQRTKDYAEENPWAKFLLTRRHAGERGYVTVAELTRDDVKFIVESHRMAAEAENAQADYWSRVLSEMERRDVWTVGDLDGPVE